MKRVFAFVSLFISSAAMAEIIGSVEYKLPSMDWEIGNRYENKKGTTLIYVPKGNEGDNLVEFFGVNENLQLSVNDATAIKETLVKLLPTLEIDFTVLEKYEAGPLYEWSAKEGSEKIIYGLGRAFSTSTGSVVLSYQTENMASLETSRSKWLPLLKEARLK